MKKSESNVPSDFCIIKVGSIKNYRISKDPKTNKTTKVAIFYTYQDLKYDIDGWADSGKYLPDDFDLVYMRLKRERTIPGWINGSTWCGLRLKPDDQVTFWKKKLEEKDS